MTFDYESFMTGVITGLKLGRVPKGRTPPAPSGRYILTESGEFMVTEPTVTQATMIDGNVWLPATQYSSERESASVVTTGLGMMICWHLNQTIVDMPSGAKMFPAMIDGIYRIVIYSYNPDDIPPRYGGYHYCFRIDYHDYIQLIGYEAAAETAGDVYFLALATEFRPDNMTMFRGTRQDLINLLANLNGQRMITEGG